MAIQSPRVVENNIITYVVGVYHIIFSFVSNLSLILNYLAYTITIETSLGINTYSSTK